jgi:hypothetical protein
MDFLRTCSSDPICKHIAKAAQAQTQSEALSKSLQSQRKKIVLKNFPTLQKNKKRNLQPDKERQKNKRIMTLNLYIDNVLQRRTTEHQLPTFSRVHAKDRP